MSACHLCAMDAPAGYRFCRACMSNGLAAWMPGPTAENVLFGVDRNVVVNARAMQAVPRWRWWLGYKLYAVVYWLLGGHA